MAGSGGSGGSSAAFTFPPRRSSAVYAASTLDVGEGETPLDTVTLPPLLAATTHTPLRALRRSEGGGSGGLTQLAGMPVEQTLRAELLDETAASSSGAPAPSPSQSLSSDHLALLDVEIVRAPALPPAPRAPPPPPPQQQQQQPTPSPSRRGAAITRRLGLTSADDVAAATAWPAREG